MVRTRCGIVADLTDDLGILPFVCGGLVDGWIRPLTWAGAWLAGVFFFPGRFAGWQVCGAFWSWSIGCSWCAGEMLAVFSLSPRFLHFDGSFDA